MSIPGFTAEQALQSLHRTAESTLTRTNERYQIQHFYKDLAVDSNRNIYPCAGPCFGCCADGNCYQTYCPPGYDCFLSCVSPFIGMFCYPL